MADGSASAAKRMWCSTPEKFQLHAAMLALQFGYAGFHVVSRAALNMGTSICLSLLFIGTSSHCFSSSLSPIFLKSMSSKFTNSMLHSEGNYSKFHLLWSSLHLKLCFLIRKERPAINLSFLVQFFLLALVGYDRCITLLILLGLDNTSPTFASAVENSVPALTFLMAAILRIEKVRLDRKDGIAKVAGTVLCVAGASVITLYKGPTIYSPASELHKTTSLFRSLGDAKNWTLGCIFLIGHCLSWSGWLVLQAPVLKKYPARLSVTSYTCFFGLIQFLIIAALFERDIEAWKFNSGGELFSILYAVSNSVLDSRTSFVGEKPGGKVCKGCHRNSVFSCRAWAQQFSQPIQVSPYSTTPSSVLRKCLTAATQINLTLNLQLCLTTRQSTMPASTKRIWVFLVCVRSFFRPRR